MTPIDADKLRQAPDDPHLLYAWLESIEPTPNEHKQLTNCLLAPTNYLLNNKAIWFVLVHDIRCAYKLVFGLKSLRVVYEAAYGLSGEIVADLLLNTFRNTAPEPDNELSQYEGTKTIQ